MLLQRYTEQPAIRIYWSPNVDTFDSFQIESKPHEDKKVKKMQIRIRLFLLIWIVCFLTLMVAYYGLYFG